MKPKSALVPIVRIAAFLATLVWLLFYFAFPDAPPTHAETSLIVVISVLAAAGVRALLKRLAVKAPRKHP
jgi:hypothetical protein